MSRNWLPFKHGGLPVVTVRIDTDLHNALLDTGSVFNFVSPDVVLRLGLQQEEEKTQAIVGINGQRIHKPKVILPAIGFAEIELNPCEAVVNNLTPLGLNITLILGFHAFAGRKLYFDVGGAKVYLLG